MGETIVSISLPNTTNGTVTIRVLDSDRTPGNRDLDTIFVDEIRIRTDNDTNGTAPAQPQNLTASAISVSQVDIAWLDVADQYGYEIDRSINGGSWVQIDMVGADVTAYQDTSVSELTGYEYLVRAFNGSGSSPDSVAASASTPEGPNNVITLTASGYKQKGKQHVTLTWSGVSPTSSVEILWDGNLHDTTAASNNPYDHKIGAKGGAIYDYQVCEANTNNCSLVQQVIF